MAETTQTAVRASGAYTPTSRIRTVVPGQPITAAHTNSMVLAINDMAGEVRRASDIPVGHEDDGVVVIAANKTGHVLDRGNVLRIGGQIKARPTMSRRIVLAGYDFADGDDMTRFGICAERINPGMTGRVFSSGVCRVKVTNPATVYTVTDEDDNPLDGVQVSVYADSSQTYLVSQGLTDSDGEITLNLVAGTYYIWRALGAYPFADPDELEVETEDRTRGRAQAGRSDLALGDTGVAEVIWEGNGGWAIVRFPVGGESAQSTANWQYVWNED